MPVKKIYRQKGDTIIEVLIAMAIISFILIGAYITINRNILLLDDSQEHSQAVYLLSSQIESLRQSKINTSINGQCFNGITLFNNTGPVGSNNCILNSSGTEASANQQPNYSITINSTPTIVHLSPSNSYTYYTYQLKATWTSLLSSSNPTATDQIIMYYSNK